ncbi:MAG: hypothetical protein ACRD8O_04600 [Bryobacteraceae bacterium]
MNRKGMLLATVVISAVAAISMSPRQLLAQVRAALVRDVDNPARQPVLLYANFSFAGFGTAESLRICTAPATCTFTVPAGKRLVVESMAVQVKIPSVQTLRGVSLVDPAFSLTDYWLQVGVLSNAGGEITYIGTHLVRIFVDSGNSLSLTVGKSLNTGGAEAHGTGYGYLVDLN